jgi:hypothetical protein
MTNIDLTPFLVFGALLILTVVAMIVRRSVIARGEDDTLHVLHGETSVPEQVTLAEKLDVIDKWGKILTIATIVYCTVIGLCFVYQQWVKATNLGI